MDLIKEVVLFPPACLPGSAAEEHSQVQSLITSSNPAALVAQWFAKQRSSTASTNLNNAKHFDVIQPQEHASETARAAASFPALQVFQRASTGSVQAATVHAPLVPSSQHQVSHAEQFNPPTSPTFEGLEDFEPLK